METPAGERHRRSLRDGPSRILILRPGAIGDTLLTFPALKLLRARFPAAEVTVVGNRPVLSLGRAAGLLDEADAFGAAWVSDLFGDEPTPTLRARLEQYDLAIVWMHAAAAAEDLAGRLARAGVRQVRPCVSFPAAGSRRHLADHLIDTLLPLGIKGPRPTVTFEAMAEDGPAGSEADTGVRPYQHLAEADGPAPFVVFHPGAGGRRKRWPAERFAALASRLAGHGYSLAVTRGPADEDAVATFQASLGERQAQLLAEKSLEELAAVLRQARLFVGNDSGITHLAAMLGTPTVALFGPFDPAYWRPIGPRVAVVDAGPACPHRADPREGCHQCNLLASLDVESVWELVLSVLSAERERLAPSPTGRRLG